VREKLTQELEESFEEVRKECLGFGGGLEVITRYRKSWVYVTSQKGDMDTYIYPGRSPFKVHKSKSQDEYVNATESKNQQASWSGYHTF